MYEYPSVEQYDETLRSAVNLHSIISEVFHRPYEALGHTVEFTFQPASNAPVFAANHANRNLLKTSTNQDIDPSRPWNITIGYDPTVDASVVSAVELPIISNDTQDRLICQRFTGIGSAYLLLRQGSEQSSPEVFMQDVDKITAREFGESNSYALPSEVVNDLVSSAGYTPIDPTANPHNQQLHIASTLTDAVSWTRQETIDVPYALNERVVLRQVTHSGNENRSSHATVTTAIIDSYNPTTNGRLQQVIEFEAIDHMVDEPRILVRELRPATDPSIIAEYGSDAQVIVSEEILPCSVENMDWCSELLQDALGDRA